MFELKVEGFLTQRKGTQRSPGVLHLPTSRLALRCPFCAALAHSLVSLFGGREGWKAQSRHAQSGQNDTRRRQTQPSKQRSPCLTQTTEAARRARTQREGKAAGGGGSTRTPGDSWENGGGGGGLAWRCWSRQKRSRRGFQKSVEILPMWWFAARRARVTRRA
jgi:hypothetical protein